MNNYKIFKCYEILNLYVNEYLHKMVRDYDSNSDYIYITINITDINSYDIADVLSMDLILNVGFKPTYIDENKLVLSTEEINLSFFKNEESSLCWSWLLSGIIEAKIRK